MQLSAIIRAIERTDEMKISRASARTRVFVAVRIHISAAPGFDGQARHIHRGERQVPASYGRFYSVDIFKHSCAAAHGGHFVKVAFGVVGLPEVVLVVFGVQKQEIRE